jgi:hypothetical protein
MLIHLTNSMPYEMTKKSAHIINDIQYVPFDDDAYEEDSVQYMEKYHLSNEMLLEPLTTVCQSYFKSDKMARLFRYMMTDLKYSVVKHILPKKSVPLEFHISDDFFMFISTGKCIVTTNTEIVVMKPLDALLVKNKTIFVDPFDKDESFVLFEITLNTPTFSIENIIEYQYYSGKELDEMIGNPDWFFAVFVRDVESPIWKTMFYYALSSIRASFVTFVTFVNEKNEEKYRVDREKVATLFSRIDHHIREDTTYDNVRHDIMDRLTTLSTFLSEKYCDTFYIDTDSDE